MESLVKALLLKAPKQLEPVDLPQPALAPGQVRMRVRNVAVCGSDYSSIAGKLPFTRFPIVPGHEASGEVIETMAASWKVGDRVLVHPILVDRSDPRFARGEVHHCDSTEVLGVVSRNGAYAEEVVVEDYMLRRLPRSMDYETGAMVESAAVAVRAVRQAGLQNGERVLVMGAGNIGLLVIQAALAFGAAHVTVTDLVPARLDLAKELGAKRALLAADDLASELENSFDVVIDGVGSEKTVSLALAGCARGGRIVVYGVPPGDIGYPLRTAFSKDVSLSTSRLYDADFAPTIALVDENRIRVKEIITHRVGLDGAPQLIGKILDGREAAIKVMIAP
jgi:2-desacetyl-2-hydroxyethyl bacteriochlorophyllide A dehydrogenase